MLSKKRKVNDLATKENTIKDYKDLNFRFSYCKTWVYKRQIKSHLHG